MIKGERINDCQQSVMTNLKLCTETSSEFNFYSLISESKLRYEVIKEIVHPLKTYSINRSIHNFTQSCKFIWCYWNLKNFIQLNFIRSCIIKNLLDWFCYKIMTLHGLFEIKHELYFYQYHLSVPYFTIMDYVLQQIAGLIHIKTTSLFY